MLVQCTKATFGKMTVQPMQNKRNNDHWNNIVKIIIEWLLYSTGQELIDVNWRTRHLDRYLQLCPFYIFGGQTIIFPSLCVGRLWSITILSVK